MLAAVRGKERHTLASDDVTTRRHATGIPRQIRPTRQGRRQIGAGQHRIEPVGKNCRQLGMVAANARQQAVVARTAVAVARFAVSRR